MSNTRNRFGLEVEEVETDKLSSRVKKIRHQGKALKNMGEVQEKADKIKDNITYLEDDLRMVEADEAREAVILRSNEPDKQSDSIEYYEVEVHKMGHTDVQRKKYQRKDSDVEDSDFVISDRLLERLGKDLDKIARD